MNNHMVISTLFSNNVALALALALAPSLLTYIYFGLTSVIMNASLCKVICSGATCLPLNCAQKESLMVVLMFN